MKIHPSLRSLRFPFLWKSLMGMIAAAISFTASAKGLSGPWRRRATQPLSPYPLPGGYLWGGLLSSRRPSPSGWRLKRTLLSSPLQGSTEG